MNAPWRRIEHAKPSPVAVQAVASDFNYILWSHEDRHVWSKRVIAPPHGNFVGWVARAMLETFAECSGQLAQFPDDD